MPELTPLVLQPQSYKISSNQPNVFYKLEINLDPMAFFLHFQLSDNLLMLLKVLAGRMNNC